jgi:hypothetical protein
MSELSPALARLIGIIAPDCNEENEPETMLDCALQWARKGLCLFPCRRFLGTPLVAKWYSAATACPEAIVAWWTETPDADIAAVPDRSGHFAIVAAGNLGNASLIEFEARRGELPAEFRYETPYGDTHVWLKGSAYTSHHKLGRGLHVLGAGHFLYLPPSLAPDHTWTRESTQCPTA